MYTKCGHNLKFEDQASAANADEVTIHHIHLQWDVDFNEKVINGKTVLDVEVLRDTDKIVRFFNKIFNLTPFLGLGHPRSPNQ